MGAVRWVAAILALGGAHALPVGAAAPAARAANPGLLPSSAAARRFAVQYSRASKNNYLAVAAVQSGLVRTAADVVGQQLNAGALGEIDLYHAAAIGTLAVAVSGIGAANWLRHLERWQGKGTSNEDVVRKAVCDYTCWAPLANSAYLLLVPLLTTAYAGHGLGLADVEGAMSTWREGFATVMGMELAIFGPYNLCAFTCIPAHFRPQTSTALSALFTIGLSGLC